MERPVFSQGIYDVSSHSISVDTSDQKSPLSLLLDGQRVIVHTDTIGSSNLDVNLHYGQRRRLVPDQQFPSQKYGIGVYERRVDRSRGSEKQSVIKETGIKATLDESPQSGKKDTLSAQARPGGSRGRNYGIGVKGSKTELSDALSMTGKDSDLSYVSLQDPTLAHATIWSESNECCSDRDCLIPGEVCVGFRCVAQGSPRFTLIWTGDDDHTKELHGRMQPVMPP